MSFPSQHAPQPPPAGYHPARPPGVLAKLALEPFELATDLAELGTAKAFPLEWQSGQLEPDFREFKKITVTDFTRYSGTGRLSNSPTKTGDDGSSYTSWSLTGQTSQNSDGQLGYTWSATVDNGRVTVSIYSDSGMTALVAQGSAELDDTDPVSVTLSAQNGSGLSGSVSVAADADSVSTGTLDWGTSSQQGARGSYYIYGMKTDSEVGRLVADLQCP